MKHLLGALALVSIATSAGAQVGHLPESSPYRDFEASQEFTFFGGHYKSGKGTNHRNAQGETWREGDEA